MDDTRKTWLFVHSNLDESNLRPSEFRILCHVARRADGKTRACFASIPSMAEVCNLNHKTVRAALARLVSGGWLLRVEHPGSRDGDAYTLAPVPPAPSPRPNPSQKTGVPENGSSTNSSAAPLPNGARHPSQKRRAKVILEGNPIKDTRPTASDEPTPTGEKELFGEHVTEHQARTAARAPRPRDELFDALANATGRNPREMTKDEARACGVALSNIRSVCPTLSIAEIERRAANYRKLFPHAAITPSAVKNQWSALGANHTRPTPRPLPDNLRDD